jgi:hypothetical protein
MEEYVKEKVNELKTVRSKISEIYTETFKRGYQPRSNLANDDNSDLFANSHSILNRWNYLSATDCT